MPAITRTSTKNTFGAVAITETTLDGSDTLVYVKGDTLRLRNPTGGAISPVIDGDGATNVNADGLGNVTTSGGFAVGSIAAGDVVDIRLDSINAYLIGTIDINSGSTLIATLTDA